MLKRYTYTFVRSGPKGYSGPKGCSEPEGYSDNSGPTGRSDNSGPTGRSGNKTISDSLLYYALWKQLGGQSLHHYHLSFVSLRTTRHLEKPFAC
ncbi:hypothetical protein CsSME_00045602 [Camellia sinensis var. sinensis]